MYCFRPVNTKLIHTPQPVILNLPLNQVQGLRFQNLRKEPLKLVDPDPEINSG